MVGNLKVTLKILCTVILPFEMKKRGEANMLALGL